MEKGEGEEESTVLPAQLPPILRRDLRHLLASSRVIRNTISQPRHWVISEGSDPSGMSPLDATNDN